MARIINSGDVTHPPTTEMVTGAREMTTGTSGGQTGQVQQLITRRRSHRKQWRIIECVFMILFDVVMLSTAFYLAYYIRYDIIGQRITRLPDPFISDTYTYVWSDFSGYLPLGTATVIGLITIFAFRRLYHLRLTGSWSRQVALIVTSSTTGMALLIAYYFIFQEQPPSRLFFLIAWCSIIVVLSTGRLMVSGVKGKLYIICLGETRLLVVGSGRLSKMIMQHIVANPNLGYSIVGFLHDLNEPPSDFGRFKMLGTLNDLGNVIRMMQIDEVIIALPSNMHQHAIRSVRMCERLGTSFKLIPDLYEMNLSRIDMDAIEGIPLISIKQVSLNTWQRLATRFIDIIVSASVLILGSPLWILLFLLVKFTSPGPALFKQTRVGLNGQHFSMYKFRSMYKDADKRLEQLLSKNEAEGPLFKMKNDPRITPIGKILRRTSLDEIPQFLNVLKGDMSLVGPRPAVPREVAQYEDWQKDRLAIKPGLTGLWQVRGRSNLSFDEGVLMDLYYIENWSLRLYIQILIRTIPAVLFSRGAY